MISEAKPYFDVNFSEIQAKNDRISRDNAEFNKLFNNFKNQGNTDIFPVKSALFSLRVEDYNLINACIRGDADFSLAKNQILAKIDPVLTRWNSDHPEKKVSVEITNRSNFQKITFQYAKGCDVRNDTSCRDDWSSTYKLAELMFWKGDPAGIDTIVMELDNNLIGNARANAEKFLGYGLKAFVEIPSVAQFCVEKMNIPTACFDTSLTAPAPAAIADGQKSAASDSSSSVSPASGSSSSAASAQ